MAENWRHRQRLRAGGRHSRLSEGWSLLHPGGGGVGGSPKSTPRGKGGTLDPAVWEEPSLRPAGREASLRLACPARRRADNVLVCLPGLARWSPDAQLPCRGTHSSLSVPGNDRTCSLWKALLLFIFVSTLCSLQKPLQRQINERNKPHIIPEIMLTF